MEPIIRIYAEKHIRRDGGNLGQEDYFGHPGDYQTVGEQFDNLKIW